MHFPLTGVGATAHADVLQSAAEAGFLMALEMVQRDDDIRIHNGTADFRAFDILAACYGDIHIVRTLQAVADDDMAAGGIGGKAVEVGSFQMVQGIFPGTDVHGIAVGEEGLAAQILDNIHQNPGIAGTQVGHIAQLAKVNLNGDKLVFKIDLVDTGGENQTGQLLGQRLGSTGAEICKINFRGHNHIPPILISSSLLAIGANVKLYRTFIFPLFTF